MIPVLLGAAALLIGGKGVKNMLSAKEKLDQAKDIAHSAERKIKRAERERDRVKANTEEELQRLGNKKISILSHNMKDFVQAFSELKHVDFRDSVGMEELRNFTPGSEVLGELNQASIHAVEIASGAVGGLAGGGAAALGAYGAVGLLGTASTGTAIAGLSGAAAANATLAWLGGGSLAAGGLGIAGGTIVLGGIVAAPALFIFGAYVESKADEALAKARSYREEAKAFAESCENTIALLNAIQTRAGQIVSVLDQLDGRFCQSVLGLKKILQEQGNDWRTYSTATKKQVGESALLAKTLKVIMDTPLLREDGTLTRESEKMLEQAGKENGISL